MRSSTYVAIAAAWVLAACVAPISDQNRDFDCATVGASCASTCDDQGFESVVGFGSEELASSANLKAALPLRVHLAVATAWPDRKLPVDHDEAVAWFSRIANETAETLAPCGIALTVDRAEVIAMPEARLSIVGNKAGSWGGAAPEGADPDAFNYALGERIPASAAELFSFARRDAADGAIAVIFVDEIHYWTDRTFARAGGLSYPPVVYHQPEDFPARNAVLVASGYGKCGGLPNFPHPRVVAHELGHMLLNTGQHASDSEDLMSPMLGSTVTPQACARMRENLVQLYGDPAVIDPGAPAPDL